MDSEVPAYGLWSLVILNSAVFIFFAFSFFKPSTTRDWRSFGAFSAFIVALFAEMYGFPLTIFRLGLAAVALSRHRLVLARCRASSGRTFWLALQSTFRTVPHSELCLHRRGIRSHLGRLEGAV